MNVSVWISLAAVFVAVAGPFFTALITGFFEAKSYKRRFVIEHSHKVIENYLQSVSRCLFAYLMGQATNEFVNFATCSAEIFTYIPKEHWQDVRDLNAHVVKYFNDDQNFQLDQAQALYFSVCERFAALGRKK